MSNYVAVCEFFESKASLFYADDSRLTVDPIGGFVTTDFDISIGNITGTTSGSITSPRQLYLSKQLKIGDLVNVSLVNFGWQSINKVYDYKSYYINGERVPEVFDTRNQLQQLFVITSFEGNRIILQDYNQFNHSFVTVGYVGNVTNMSFLELLSVITKRDMRAFASRTYPLSNGKGRIPFRVNASFHDKLTSFTDDFEKTNVKPWDVIVKAIKGLQGIKYQAIRLGATVRNDGDGFYVFSYLQDNTVTAVNGEFDVFEDYVIKIKPTTSVKLSENKNTSVNTVWIQPRDNDDNYIRAGVVVAVNTPNGTIYKTIGKLSVSDYNDQDITNTGTILIGYNQLFENHTFDNYIPQKFKGEAPDKTMYSDEKQFKQDHEAYKQAKHDADTRSKEVTDNINAFNEELKKRFEPLLTPSGVKVLLSDALSRTASLTGRIENPFNSNIDWENIVHENINNIIKGAMDKQYTPLTVSLSENDIFATNVEFSGDERFRLYLTNKFGTSLRGEF